MDWTKTHSLPGLLGVPVYDVIMFVLKEIRRDSIVTRANSIAFSFFLSLFPSFLALFTLIPYILPFFFNETLLSYLPDNAPIIYQAGTQVVDYNETLLQHFDRMLPDFTGKTDALDYIRSWANGSQAGLLSFSFVLALFFASNGMMTLMNGFEKSYKSTFTRRNAFQKRMIAIYLTFIIGLLVLGSFFFILLSSPVIDYLQNLLGFENLGSKGTNLLSFALLIALLYTGISLIYRLAAPTLRKFQFFSTGATLATTLSLLTTAIFSYYVNEFDTYNRLYSSIGTVIVIMLTIQFNCLILLIGYELNASIAVNLDLRKSLKDQKD